MKVMINGNVSKDAIKIILDNQKEKIKIIDEYCKENKFFNFCYKDSELEYEFERVKTKTPEVRNEK